MVKNTKGGNRGKRVARKHINSQSTKAVRYAIDEDERYAIVTQFYGISYASTFSLAMFL